jgi:hypothetical protein
MAVFIQLLKAFENIKTFRIYACKGMVTVNMAVNPKSQWENKRPGNYYVNPLPGPLILSLLSCQSGVKNPYKWSQVGLNGFEPHPLYWIEILTK